MMHRLVLAGGLVMLLVTSSFARMADGSHCRFNRQCASRHCEGGICRSVGRALTPLVHRACGIASARAASVRAHDEPPGIASNEAKGDQRHGYS